MILSCAQRQAHWNWCREFIDREAIYRVDEMHPKLPAKAGGFSIWQIYTLRATLNPEFAYRLGLLFWDHFLPVFQQQPFQVCACAESGIPIGVTIAATARRLRVSVNTFMARRMAKRTGTDNWFDGRILQLPVLIVDDVAASAPFMRQASARIQTKLNLPLHYNYFAIIDKVGGGFAKHSQHTEAYLDNQLIALFTMNNVIKAADKFKARYGRPNGFSGILK